MAPRNYTVSGRCPSCGLSRLVLKGDVLRCTNPACAEPNAAQRILFDADPTHLMQIHDDETFTLRHPLIERLDDRLMECRLHGTIQDALRQFGHTLEHGRYRVALVEDGTVHWSPA